MSQLMQEFSEDRMGVAQPTKVLLICGIGSHPRLWRDRFTVGGAAG
jgi:hypothetical protein